MIAIGGIGSLSANQLEILDQIDSIGQALAQNSLQMSTLKRINSAADDPAGIVAATLLQTNLTAAQTTANGLTQASAMLNTADDTAGQIVTQLQQAQTLALQALGGTLTPDQIASNQVQLDTVIQTIDSLAQTGFNGQRLLDGSSGYSTSGVDNSKISNVNVLSVQSQNPVSVSVQVTRQATQATDSYTGGALAQDTTLAITGKEGTATVSLSNGATTSDIATAVNSVAYETGVNAAVNGGNVNFNSSDYGSSAKIQITATQGTFNTTAGGSAVGIDAQATINGQSYTASGTTFNVNGNDAAYTLTLNPSASGTISPFTISGTGLKFVIGTDPSQTANIGLPALDSAHLGGVDGLLSSVMSGGANSLVGANPATALRVINEALSQATAAQGQIGGFQKYTLDSASTVLNSTITNMTSALNNIQGTDVATQQALMTHNQLLMQAAQQALAMSEIQQQNVLNLLTQSTGWGSSTMG
ncbi:MAG TPA: flagellin [Planctomycetaceae bacterium]|nr:flagellin [Planctomycetaceae bacterium]